MPDVVVSIAVGWATLLLFGGGILLLRAPDTLHRDGDTGPGPPPARECALVHGKGLLGGDDPQHPARRWLGGQQRA